MAIISVQEQLIKLFNDVNEGIATPLTEADVTIGAVAAYAPADNADKRNSKLTLTAVAESANFTGSKELHYTRLALALGAIEITPESDEEWMSSANLITTLNTELQKQFPEDEFTIADFNNSVVTHEIGEEEGTGYPTRTYSIAAGHIKWLEKTAVLVVTRKPVPVEKTDLATTNGELDGFSQ